MFIVFSLSSSKDDAKALLIKLKERGFDIKDSLSRIEEAVVGIIDTDASIESTEGKEGDPSRKIAFLSDSPFPYVYPYINAKKKTKTASEVLADLDYLLEHGDGVQGQFIHLS